MEPVKCKKCGSKPCICSDNGKWAAHCMSCNNQIGEPGLYDPCANSKQEATELWNKLNEDNHG